MEVLNFPFMEGGGGDDPMCVNFLRFPMLRRVLLRSEVILSELTV